MRKGTTKNVKGNATANEPGTTAGNTAPEPITGTPDSGTPDSGTSDFIEPDYLAGGSTSDYGYKSDGTPRKRRANRTIKSDKKKVSSTLEGLESILLSLHMMGANFLKCPELELDPKEASKMSDAISRVAALYDIEASEATLAWINLAVVIGPVYVFRFFAIKARLDSETEEAKRKKLVSINA